MKLTSHGYRDSIYLPILYNNDMNRMAQREEKQRNNRYWFRYNEYIDGGRIMKRGHSPKETYVAV